MSICILSNQCLVLVPVEGWDFHFECPYVQPLQNSSFPPTLLTPSTSWHLIIMWQLSGPRCPKCLWSMLMSIEEEDTSFAATFCAIGVVSSVYRSVLPDAYAQAITLPEYLSMYSHTLLFNMTLQWGRRTDCLMDSKVTLRSGTQRMSLNLPSFAFLSTLNRREIVPFPVAKTSELSPRLTGIGFNSFLNEDLSNSSILWVMWFDAPESGCVMKRS